MDVEVDPPIYERDYQWQVFEETLKLIHPKLSCFHKIKKIDFSHQLIGDDNCRRLCDTLKGCKLQHLNLAGNRLTDDGIDYLGKTLLRSLSNLISLNISWNEFSDKGLTSLVDENHYSPSVTDLDLTYNKFTIKGAFAFTTTMFQNTKVCSTLHTIRIGGRIDRHVWEDAFLQILLSGLYTGNKLKSMKHLQFSEMMGISEIGIYSLLGVLCSSHSHTIECIDISNNLINNEQLKISLIHAVMSCPSTIKLQVINCGFSKQQLEWLERISGCPEKRKEYFAYLTYSKQLQLCILAQYAENQCQRQYFLLKQSMLNTWKLTAPSRWNPLEPDIQTTQLYHEYSSILFQDMKSMFSLHLKQTVAQLNEQIAYLYHIQIIRTICELKTMNNIPFTIGISPPNGQYLLYSARDKYLLIEQSKREIAYHKTITRIEEINEKIKQLSQLSKNFFIRWNDSLQQFLSFLHWLIDEKITTTTVGYLKKLKYVIPILETDQLYMLIEELQSQCLQKCILDQEIIGLIYEKRIRISYLEEYFTISSGEGGGEEDENSSVSSQKSNDMISKRSNSTSTVTTLTSRKQRMQQQSTHAAATAVKAIIDYEDYLQQGYSCCISNFSSMGYFVYYYQIVYHKDKE